LNISQCVQGVSFQLTQWLVALGSRIGTLPHPVAAFMVNPGLLRTPEVYDFSVVLVQTS
jgi:hypothetical protein